MIRTPKGLFDWLFIMGLVLPSLYVAIFPGIYLTTWYHILVSTTSGGITMIILFAGLLKAVMYVSGQLGKAKGKLSRRIGDAFFAFHVAVDVSVLLAMFWVGIIQGQRDAAVGAFYALFATEFMVFPIIGVSFLQDAIRHRRQNLASSLLASIAIYLCVVILAVSNFIDQSVLNIAELSPLEAVGAKVFSVLIFFVSLARTPIFWQTSSLYSVDIVAPPFWVGGVYVVTVAFYLFYDAHRELDRQAESVSAVTSYAHVPLDVVRASKTVLAATIVALMSVSVSDFLLPHNVSGDVFQLFLVSVILLMSFRFMGRKACQL